MAKDWTETAAEELKQLEADARADPRGFYHIGEQRSALDGPGIKRVMSIAPTLEELARRARGLIRS